jgi:two-component system sensor histidine kinase BaeS
MRLTRMLPKSIVSASLKSKLILSYLVVILGTVLILSIVVSVVIQSFFHSLQSLSAQQQASSIAASISRMYQHAGSWSQIQPLDMSRYDNQSDMLYITDANGDSLNCLQPPGLSEDICHSSFVQRKIQQTIQYGKSDYNDISLPTPNQSIQSSVYAVEPIQLGDQIIGAVFMTQPQFSQGQVNLLDQIRSYILLAGLGVALVAAFCAYLLVGSIIRPLNALTMAAERMKSGKYTERVSAPSMHDELGRLALTFNEMADTIEADVNELRQQDQMRRDLIANIAHDLATPLTAIQGLSEALADDVIAERTVRQETAQRIGREVQRLRRMVAEVRQMTQMEAGQVKMDLAPLDLHSLVDETVAVIAPECEQVGITIKNDIAPNTPLVQADSDRITQVLLNLLDNARRHTKRDGTIRVTTTIRQDKLIVSVNDTGVGISTTDLPHIFERFYRADRSRTTQTGGGSGLGLSIVKAIVTAHGGQIWAASTPGKGTSISFTLPMTRTRSLVHPRMQQVASQTMTTR